MAVVRIFQQTVGLSTYEVRVVDGVPQYVIDGEVQEGMTLNAFISSAAVELGGEVLRNGKIKENALENYENGDTLGDRTNPSIREMEKGGADIVKIAGNGVGGNYQASFEDGADADDFSSFVQDLLGKSSFTKVAAERVVLDGDARKVVVTQRDDDIRALTLEEDGSVALNNQGKEKTKLVDEFVFTVSGAGVAGREKIVGKDAFIAYLGAELGGTQTKNGSVSETYTANQIHIENDGLSVDLGSQGVGGKEVWLFADEETAQTFLDTVELFV